MQRIKINAIDFWKGASTNDFLPTGGFSNFDKGHNLYKTKGLLYPQPSETDVAALSDDGLVASGINHALSKLFCGVVADGGDGYFYTFASDGTPTLASTDTGRDYSSYASDLIFYNDTFFITSKTDIASLTSTFGTPDYDWWTTVAGGTGFTSALPHQMLIFEDVLYIADNANIKSWDKTTAVDSALDLQTDFKITAFVIYNGKFYISAEKLYNAGGKNSVTSKMFIWNGTDPSYSKVIDLPEKIFTMINYNGLLLLFGPYSIYAYNGVGFTRIFDLLNTTRPVYKHRILNYKDRIYFANGDFIICYDGYKFSYFFDSANGSANIKDKTIESIGLISNDRVIMTSGSRALTLDLDDGDGTSYWRSNRYELGSSRRVKNIIIELGEDLVSGSDMEFTLIDEKGDEKTIGSMTYAGGDRIVKQFKNINKYAISFQIRVRFKTNAKSIRAITVEHESIGNPVRKP